MALEGARISQNNGNTGLNGMDISVSKTNSSNKISDGLSTTTSTQTQTQAPINTSYQQNVEVEELDLTETTQPEQNVVNEVEENDGNILTGAISIVGDWASATVDWFGDKLNDLYHFVSEGGILEKATEAINNILSKTGATVAAIGLGLVEGICSLVEAIIDTAAILQTIAFTTVTVLVDLVGKAFGKDFGFTEKLWDMTMGFVSEKWVSGAFDKFYEETKAGQWIADNSLAFDKVRSISSGIGYVAGMIALTIATCGIGTAPTITAAISSTATQGAVIAGTAGFGKGAEEAWDSGATALEGLGYASVRGVAEGVSYYLGGKMAGVTIGSGTSLGSKLLTSGVRISFDTIDGGASGFIDPAAKMIYNDKNFSESFEENGGWNTVLTNAAIGGATSAAGEIADNIKIRKNNVSVDVDTPTMNSKTSQYSVADISNLKNEYDELIKVTKEPWFIDAKKAMDNGFAGNLNDIAAADDIIKRINEIESTLLIESNIPQFKQNDYSQAKKQADAQSRNINQQPIPGFENIDKNNVRYNEIMAELYSKPSPSGKQNLMNFNTDSLLVNDNFELNKALSILDEQGGEGYGMRALDHYAKTGSVLQYQNGQYTPYITNKEGIRDFVASLDPQSVRIYLDQKIDNKLMDSILILDEQGGQGYGKKALNHYVETGSVLQYQNGQYTPYITNKEGTRDFISGLDVEKVKSFLNNIDNIDGYNIQAINLFKNTPCLSQNFTDEQIKDAFSKIHTFATEQDFLNEAGAIMAHDYGTGGALCGFNRKNQVYINPLCDNLHTRIHEALHNITSVFDPNGTKVVTGFQWFDRIRSGDYSNGGIIFNEGATDYLTHKLVGDGCKSGNYMTSFKFFEAIDSMLEDLHGNNNILFDSYIKHDATFIKNFVNKYGGKNLFDDKISKIEFLSERQLNEILDKIRHNVSKELNPSATRKISNKLKNIFGG